MQVILSDPGTLRLVCDIGLMAALCYMGFRFMRYPQTGAYLRQIAELEGTLKGLIREAGLAGSDLNSQLVKRQQSLEKLLMELETAAQQVGRAVEGADETRLALERTLTRGRDSVPERRRVPEREAAAPAEEIRRSAIESATRAEPAAEEAPEAPSFESIHDDAPAREEKPSWSGRNIYGEPIAAKPAEPRPAARSASPIEPRSTAEPRASSSARSPVARPLSQSIEREVDENRPGAINDDLERIYLVAEEMLKTGKDLDFVAARTKLPIEEVRMLSQLIIRDQLEEQGRLAEQYDDPRLGALGSRRQTV